MDLIVHAGDFTYNGEIREVQKFLKWFGEQQSRDKILICGNHEVQISKQFDLLKSMCENEGIQLLHNSHTVIGGKLIFGSPYSVEFGNWVYSMEDERLQDVWDYINPKVDILITHGPAYKRLDRCPGGNVGSETLSKHIDSKLEELKLHITGHIHESRGVMYNEKYVTVNAAICGIPYSDVIINPIVVSI